MHHANMHKAVELKAPSTPKISSTSRRVMAAPLPELTMPRKAASTCAIEGAALADCSLSSRIPAITLSRVEDAPLSVRVTVPTKLRVWSAT